MTLGQKLSKLPHPFPGVTQMVAMWALWQVGGEGCWWTRLSATKCPGMRRCSVVQLCPTLCDLLDCSPPGFSVHGILQVRTGVGCHSLLQGIFLIQGSNLHLLHWQADCLPLSHLGSPKCPGVTADSTEPCTHPPRERTISLIAPRLRVKWQPIAVDRTPRQSPRQRGCVS